MWPPAAPAGGGLDMQAAAPASPVQTLAFKRAHSQPSQQDFFSLSLLSHPACPPGPTGTSSPLARPVCLRSPTELTSQGRKQSPGETRGRPPLLPCQGHPQHQNPPASSCRKHVESSSATIFNTQTPLHPLKPSSNVPIPFSGPHIMNLI